MALKVDQSVNRDGTSTVVEEIDFSGFISFYESMGEDADISEALENLTSEMRDICSEAQSQGIDCVYSESDYTITFTAEVTPDEAGYEFERENAFPSVIYKFRTDQFPDIGLSEIGEESSMIGEGGGAAPGKFSEMDDESLQMAKMMGVEYEYIITMPGEITEAKNGEIDDEGRAVYDVMELIEEGKTIEVASQETDYVGSLCAPALALASALLFAAFARRG
jgi:hypothetical protein